MEKIKDFFYDKNDLVVALIIIAVAGLLIAWRVDIIMDYPQAMAAELEQQQQEGQGDALTADGEDETGGEDPAGTDSGGGNDAGAPQGNGDVQAPAGSGTGGSGGSGAPANGSNAQANGGSGSGSGAAVDPPKNNSAVTVTIPAGSSGEKIAQILVDAGVVSSKSDFTTAVANAKADTKLKAGTFSIPAGASVADIVAIITK